MEKAQIIEFFISKDLPVSGIAAVCELPHVPEGFSPTDMLEGAASIICYAVPIPKGIIRANRNGLALFWRYCNMLYRSLDITSNQLCLMLEEKGHLAVPIYGCFPWKMVGREFWGLLPLVYWAEQAGLGTLTKCGLLANPTYGTRILLGGVVTTSAVKPTEKVTGQLCPSHCVDCIEACPVDAIAHTGKVNHNACIRYSGSNPLMAHLLEDQKVIEKFSFETIVNTVGVDDHGTYTCHQCLKACPLNNT
jgi:epoxyqueuosine reductase QueG